MNRDHARPERQRFLSQCGTITPDPRVPYGYDPTDWQIAAGKGKSFDEFARDMREVHLSQREFYGWLFMAFCFGFVAAVVLGGLIGRPI